MRTWNGSRPIWRPPLGAVLAAVVLWVVLAAILTLPAEGQVTAHIIIEGRSGTVHVHNPRDIPVRAELDLWECNSCSDREWVELTEPAKGRVWPASFRLGLGGRQTVRLLVADVYPPGTLLRLETRFVPLQTRPIQTSGEGRVKTRVKFVYRILSRVEVVGGSGS